MRKLVIIALLALPLPVHAQDAQEEPGFVEKFLEDSLSGAGRVVDIQGFAGALSSTATMQAMTIADNDGIWLTLKDVTLNWSRSALLSKRLEISELSATELIVSRRPTPADSLPSAEATPFALPDLPVSVNIGKVQITRAELGEALLGQEAVLTLTGAAALAGGEGQANLTVARVTPDEGSLAFAASYSNATRNLALNLALDEPRDGLAATLLDLPGRPALSLTLAGEGPIDAFSAQLDLSSDGQKRLGGQIALTATETGQQFAMTLNGDIAPLFTTEYQPFFGPQMELRLSGTQAPTGEIALNDLSIASDALHLSGRVLLDADGWPQLAQINATLAPRSGEDVLLPLAGPQTRLRRAQVGLDYDAGKGDLWSLSATLDGLQRPDLTLQSARLTAGGTLQRPQESGTKPGQIAGTIQADLTGIMPLDQSIAAAIGRDLRGVSHFAWTRGKPFEVQSLTLTGQGFDLSGEARISTIPATTDLLIDATATLRTPDLSRFAGVAGYPVSGGAALRLAGRVYPISGAFDLVLSGETQSLALQQPRLDPLLKGTGRLALSAKRDAGGTELRQLEIGTTRASLSATGHTTRDTSALRLAGQIADIQPIIPELTGAATIKADLARQSSDWQFDVSATGPGALTARATGTAKGHDWSSLTARGTVTASAQQLEVYEDLAGSPLRGSVGLTLKGSGAPAKRVFDLALDMSGSGLATGLPQLDQVLHGQAELSIQAARDAEGLYSLTHGVLTTPELTASATTNDDQDIEFTANLRDLSLVAPGLAGPASTSGTATLKDRHWWVRADGTGPGGTHMTASGTVARDGSRVDVAVTGGAPLALVNDLIRPQSLNGTADYDLQLSGPLALSSLAGRISTRDARFTIPNQGLAIEGISADITLDQSKAQVSMQGRVVSGGTVQVSGAVGLSAPYVAAVQADLSQVQFRDPRLFETSATGTIGLQGPLTGGAVVSGRLNLGPTELRVPNPSGTSYADLPGLQHVNEPPAVFKTRANAGMVASESDGKTAGGDFGLDLQIIAIDRIFVRGRGLDAELGGALRLQGSTLNVVPQGRFDLIRGRLDILGKRLNLDEGLISLQGAFDPYLRFAASTQTGDVTANIAIEGQASAPELTFTSTPELPQDEVLALILFGKEINSISPLQAVRLAAAISTLTGRGGGLGDSVRKGLAVDDLDVTTTDEGATEARVGKYLSENIYSEVTADSEGNTQINLNLNISRSITARGRLGSDGETGLGLFIERDY